MGKQTKLTIHVIIALIFAIGVSNINPPEGLTVQSMRFMGIFLGVIWIMLTNVIDDFVIGILGLMLCVFSGAVSFTDAVACFSNKTFLLIMAALGLGAAVIKTGLLNRLSLHMLKLFPKSYNGQLSAVLATGLIISPFIPAAASKSALGGPLASSVGEALGFPKKGNGMNGLFAMSYISFCVLGLIFLSGTAYALLTIGMMTPEDAATVTWIKWLLYSLPWGIVVTVLCFAFIKMVYKPENLDSVNDPDFINKKIEALGPATRIEKISGIILLVCIIGWVLSSWLKVSSEAIALTGLTCMFLFGVFEKKDLRARMPWEMIAFIASILGYATLLSTTGWSKWLGVALGGALGGVISNVYVYVIVLSIAVYIARFVVISQTATFSLFFVLMGPIAATYGIHPFITGFVTSAACMVWNSKYQNSTWLTAYASAGGEDVLSYKAQFKMSVAYSVIAIIAALISIPFWRMMGLC